VIDGPYISPKVMGRQIQVEALPGPYGVDIARPLRPIELRTLSDHFEGVEFGMFFQYKPGRGQSPGGQWTLVSGRPGEFGYIEGVGYATGPNMYMGPHTHPSGLFSNFASKSDRNMLELAIGNQLGSGIPLQQSAIVVSPDSTFRFNIESPNLSYPGTTYQLGPGEF
jgi:hypothetical protein